MSQKPKDPHAVALGKKGGHARAKKLGPEGCSEAARAAVTIRWDKVRAAEAKLKRKRKRGPKAAA